MRGAAVPPAFPDPAGVSVRCPGPPVGDGVCTCCGFVPPPDPAGTVPDPVSTVQDTAGLGGAPEPPPSLTVTGTGRTPAGACSRGTWPGAEPCVPGVWPGAVLDVPGVLAGSGASAELPGLAAGVGADAWR